MTFEEVVRDNRIIIIGVIKLYLRDYQDDVEDVLQQTLMHIWRGLKTFRNESQLSSWLYRIAANCSLMFLRDIKRTDKLDYFDDGNHPPYKHRHDEILDARVKLRKLSKKIYKTDPNKAVKVLLLFDADAISASKALRISIPAWKSIKNRTRAKLKNAA